jgi:DNA polymerase Pol2
MSAHVENYIIHHISDYNEIIEKKPILEISERIEEEKYEGAFVLAPKPGLYENIVFFDFTSMYGSIIVSFNLSLTTYREKRELNTLEVELENKSVFFSREAGFFSLILKEIIDKRKKYKKEYNLKKDNISKARSNAFKLLANASYGYQGFFGARYYCREAAAATAAIARKYIKDTIKLIENNSYKVVYSDTDSIAFLREDKSKKQVLDLLKEINKNLPGIMELDLEDFYLRGIFVSKRTGDFGAKKKYALINEDKKLKIRGFETVRRDWCDLSRNTQNKVLELVLSDGTEKRALEFVKETIKKLKDREIDKSELIIRTQLKKPVEEYKSESPHVTIAKKMMRLNLPIKIGMLIEYYISEPEIKPKYKKLKRKNLVRERAKMLDEKGDYDTDYYLNNQILPAVENIFDVFGVSLSTLLSNNSSQKRLKDF